MTIGQPCVWADVAWHPCVFENTGNPFFLRQTAADFESCFSKWFWYWNNIHVNSYPGYQIRWVQLSVYFDYIISIVLDLLWCYQPCRNDDSTRLWHPQFTNNGDTAALHRAMELKIKILLARLRDFDGVDNWDHIRLWYRYWICNGDTTVLHWTMQWNPPISILRLGCCPCSIRWGFHQATTVTS